MRLGFTADGHIDNMRRTYLVDGIPNRQRDLDAQFNHTVAMCLKYKVELVFFAGDLFESSYVKGYHFARGVDYLRLFLRAGIYVVVLAGNHEVSEKGGSMMPALKKLKDEHLHVIDKVKVGIFGTTPSAGSTIKFLLLPHERREVFAEYRTYTEYVRSLCQKYRGQYDIVVGHFQPTSVVVPHDSEAFVGSSRLLDTSVFPAHIPVFCGHVHGPADKANLHVIGSPTRMFFGEKDDTKRFLIWDSKLEKHRSIPLNCQSMHVLKIGSSDSVIKIIAAEKEKLQGAMVKVEVTTTSRNVSVSKHHIQSLLSDLQAHVISFKVMRERTVTSTLKKASIVGEMRPSSLFRATVRSIIKDKEERQRIEHLGLSVMEECDAQSNRD